MKKEHVSYCRVVSKSQCHDILLIVTIVNILVGLIALYLFMGTDGRWAVEPVRREKVLAMAVFLFLSACALCWFIMRKEQLKWVSERKLLIVDRPPSYNSCVPHTAPIDQPPPSYFSVANRYHIV